MSRGSGNGFQMYDQRRLQMAALGFEVAQLRVDETSHEVVLVAYRFIGEPITPLEGRVLELPRAELC